MRIGGGSRQRRQRSLQFGNLVGKEIKESRG